MKRKVFVLEIAILPDAPEENVKTGIKTIAKTVFEEGFAKEGSFESNRRYYIGIPELPEPCGFFAFKEFDDGEDDEQRLLEETEAN
jgi:hypothetical protein